MTLGGKNYVPFGGISYSMIGYNWPTRFNFGYMSYTAGDRAKVRTRGSIAQRNRWTGKPHEDKRAMARLEKQQARNTYRKFAKFGTSGANDYTEARKLGKSAALGMAYGKTDV